MALAAWLRRPERQLVIMKADVTWLGSRWQSTYSQPCRIGLAEPPGGDLTARIDGGTEGCGIGSHPYLITASALGTVEGGIGCR